MAWHARLLVIDSFSASRRLVMMLMLCWMSAVASAGKQIHGHDYRLFLGSRRLDLQVLSFLPTSVCLDASCFAGCIISCMLIYYYYIQHDYSLLTSLSLSTLAYFFSNTNSPRTLARTTTRKRRMPMASKRPSEASLWPKEVWTPSFWETKSMPRNTMVPSVLLMTNE